MDSVELFYNVTDAEGSEISQSAVPWLKVICYDRGLNLAQFLSKVSP
jgi:hypothetical protein